LAKVNASGISHIGMTNMEGFMNMRDRRLQDLKRFYSILDRLDGRVGGVRELSACNGEMAWPRRGIYFFYEPGELRRKTGDGPRVVRVGTHALKSGSKTSLWQRLSQHRGTQKTGGGNHRGSVFRKHVGKALLARDPDLKCCSWGVGNNATSEIKKSETDLEVMVSRVIGEMPFLWLNVDDSPGPNSDRGYLERNAIALLSNYTNPTLNEASPDWLGTDCVSEQVRNSGLWNSNHVDEDYDILFLDRFEQLVERQHP
jgi:hypothetical protein